MAMLQHQGIVQVLEQQLEDGGYHFFVMECLGVAIFVERFWKEVGDTGTTRRHCGSR